MPEDPSVNETPYSEEELQHFKKLLEDEWAETNENLDNLHASLEDIESNTSDENTAAAHHQSDVASDEDEREKLLIMIGKEDEKMDEIKAALDRIEQKTYGICEDTGKKIQKGRLEAIPYTRYSVNASKNH
ncbi:MAG TPA: TraR/DksA C4-type zinc finger protein [Balneolaceae bacterium]|nr:TraR/DksA C4-type zinc finger protein [Balneolaceae bacterium]